MTKRKPKSGRPIETYEHRDKQRAALGDVVDDRPEHYTFTVAILSEVSP